MEELHKARKSEKHYWNVQTKKDKTVKRCLIRKSMEGWYKENCK